MGAGGYAARLLLVLPRVVSPHRYRSEVPAIVVSPQLASLAAIASVCKRHVAALPPFDVSPSQMKPENWREVCRITHSTGWEHETNTQERPLLVRHRA